MDKSLAKRAMFLANQITGMTKELEGIKEQIRKAHTESTVLDLGTQGHIVVTVPSPVWVLRSGKTYRDCETLLGSEVSNSIFKTNVQVNIDQEALNSAASDPELASKLVTLLDQQTHVTRIGFRPAVERD